MKREDSKHIEGFEDYLIFSAGKVYSLKRKKYLKPFNNTHGYYHVRLCKSGKPIYKYMARLVAQAFIPNPDNKPEVNHKDGIKANNDISNLEWVTHSENMLHAFATGLKEKTPNTGRPEIPINVYDYTTGQFLSFHPSQSDAARMHGLFQGNISQVLLGKRKQAGGLTFERTSHEADINHRI